ncbi:response regulator [Petrachloros mirabilis]
MDGYGKRILVIDDDLNSRARLAVQLERKGYAVHEALDKVAGVDEMRKRHFDAVIANCHMAEFGNAEFGRFVKLAWPNTPVILVFSDVNGLREMINDFDEAAYVHPPFETARLIRILRRITQPTATEETALPMASMSE